MKIVAFNLSSPPSDPFIVPSKPTAAITLRTPQNRYSKTLRIDLIGLSSDIIVQVRVPRDRVHFKWRELYVVASADWMDLGGHKSFG